MSEPEALAERAELLAEAADAATRVLEDGGLRIEASRGGFEITVREADGEIRVEMGAVAYAIELGDTPEDFAEARALALDLVGACLFGDVTLRTESFRTGEIRSASATFVDRWGRDHTLGQAGHSGLNPFSKKRAMTLRNDYERPSEFAAADFDGLPWAPWAGACGYCGQIQEVGAAELAVDGELDLHPFHPKEVKPLVLAYIEACQEQGITQLRIVHGKGKGVLRRTVHALLERHEDVIHFELGGMGGGSWGATIVDLKPGPGA